MAAKSTSQFTLVLYKAVARQNRHAGSSRHINQLIDVGSVNINLRAAIVNKGLFGILSIERVEDSGVLKA